MDQFGVGDNNILEEDAFGVVTPEVIPPKVVDERAATTLLYNGYDEDTLAQDFEQAADKNTLGDSSAFEEVRQGVTAVTNETREKVALDLLTDESAAPEFKYTFLEDYKRESEEESIRYPEYIQNDLSDIFLTEHLANIKSWGESGYNPEEVADTIVKTYEGVNDSLTRKEKKNTIIQENLPSFLEIAGGVLKEMLPPLAATERYIPYAKTTQKILEKYSKAGAGRGVIPGEGVKIVNDLYHSLPQEQRPQFMEDLVQLLKQHTGTADTEQDWAAFTYIVSALEDDPGRINIDRWLENAGAFFDATIVGIWAARFGGMLKGLSKVNAIGKALRNDPVTMSKAAAAVVQGGQKGKVVERATGITLDDVIREGMPMSEEIAKHPADLLRLSVNRVKANEIIEQVEATGGMWKKDSFLKAEGRLREDLLRDGVHTQKTSFDYDYRNAKVNFKGYVGYDATRGYINAPVARLHAARKGYSEFNIVKRGDEGYFIETSFTKPLILDDTLPIPEHQILARGKSSNYYKDINSKFKKESGFQTKFVVASDKSYYVQTEFTKMLKPFQKLGDKSKGKVLDKLYEGNRGDGHVFSADELKAADWTDNEIKGYQTYRDVEDTFYLINNNLLRNQYINEGLKTVENTSGGYTSVAKVIDKPKSIKYPGGSIAVHNPKTGIKEVLAPSEVELLYKNGDSLGLLRFEENGATYIKISKGEGTAVTDLPHFVLNYRPGYVTRHYKDEWFIKSTEAGIPTGTHAIAPSRMEAEEIARQMTDAGDGTVFKAFQERKTLKAHEVSANKEEYLKNTGGLYFSKRKYDPLSEEAITDPIESMDRAINDIGRRATFHPAVRLAKKEWLDTWGDHFGLKTYPQNVDEIRGARVASITDEQLKKAQGHYMSINIMDHVEDPANLLWKHKTQELSEWLQKSSIPMTTNIAKGIDKISDASPFSILKSATFIRYLGTFPSRQFVLQSSQPLMLALMEPKYMASKFWIDKAILDTGMLTREWNYGSKMDSFAKAASTVYKASGIDYSPTDVKKIVEAFHKSGMQQSIKHGHSYTTYTKLDFDKEFAGSFLKKTSKYAKNAALSPFKLSMEGFTLGEYNNVSSNWLIALQRFQKNNPKKSLDQILSNSVSMDHIHTTARGIGLNMSESGMFEWQKGWLSLFGQFQAINIKTAMTLFGQNQFIQGADLGRVWTMLALTYGSEGVGLGRVVDKAMLEWDKSNPELQTTPEFRDVLTGGLADYLTYKITGTRASVASSISPASGALGYNSFTSMFLDLFEGRKSVAEMFLGPAGSTVIDAGSTMSTVASMIRTYDMNDPKLMKAVTKEVIDYFPSASKYTKAKLALDTGNWVDKHGDPIVSASWKEAVAFAAFGFQPTRVEEAYLLNMTAKKREQGLTLDANNIYDAIQKVIDHNRFGTEKKNPKEIQTINELIARETAILQRFSPQDAEVVWGKLLNRAKKDLRFEKGFLHAITKNAMYYNYGSDSEALQDLASRLKESYPDNEGAVDKYIDIIANPESGE